MVNTKATPPASEVLPEGGPPLFDQATMDLATYLNKFRNWVMRCDYNGKQAILHLYTAMSNCSAAEWTLSYLIAQYNNLRWPGKVNERNGLMELEPLLSNVFRFVTFSLRPRAQALDWSRKLTKVCRQRGLSADEWMAQVQRFCLEAKNAREEKNEACGLVVYNLFRLRNFQDEDDTSPVFVDATPEEKDREFEGSSPHVEE